MKTFLVTNPKGGSGKTTLATNLAGYFASRGKRVLLSDLDRQGSSMSWLERRPEHLPEIMGIAGKYAKKHHDPEVTIIDSPAGLRGDKLSEAVKTADFVIVPMQSSIFDIHATQDFLEVLKAEKAVRKERTFVAMVGMRVASRTIAATKLEEYLTAIEFPVMGYLRNAQIYPQTADEGKSLFDLSPSRAQKDIEQWAALIKWIKAAEKLAK
jgi:chromosome partitioning protein